MEVLAGGPLVSRVATGWAKKEGTMQETHCIGGGGVQGQQGEGGCGDADTLIYLVVCLIIVQNPGSHESVYAFNFETTHKRSHKFKCL